MQVSKNRSNPKSSSGQTITARLEASISEASRRKRSACAWRLEAKIKGICLARCWEGLGI